MAVLSHQSLRRAGDQTSKDSDIAESMQAGNRSGHGHANSHACSPRLDRSVPRAMSVLQSWSVGRVARSYCYISAYALRGETSVSVNP